MTPIGESPINWGMCCGPERVRFAWEAITLFSCRFSGPSTGTLGRLASFSSTLTATPGAGYFGSPHSHGTPVKYAIEEGLIEQGCALASGIARSGLFRQGL